MITLKTLAQATAQEVFDQVARHLLTQNAKAIGPTGCYDYVYLTPEGLKCAAGCLIADNEYSVDFEYEVWGSLVAQGVAPEAHEELITALQVVHDGWEVCEWPDRLRANALLLNLNTEVLE